MSKPFNYGGQAVIEGVMMRGKKFMAVAVRNPAGEIVLHSEPLPARIYSSFISKVPFVRGLVLLWDALVLGMRTLMFSAEVATGAPMSSATRSAFDRSRFHTTTSKPARAIVPAMAPPIRPVPSTATVASPSLTVQ